MIKFENTNVVGWEAAIRGMRNPLNSWDKSDSEFDRDPINYFDENDMPCTDLRKFVIGENDLDLMQRLRNAGTDHRKFLRMIVVYVDITAPLYWWKEFDTYKVGTVANSCSTMHKIADKEFTLDDFSHEHLIDDVMFDEFQCKSSLDVLYSTIDMLNLCIEKYNDISKQLEKKDLTDNERKFIKAQQKIYWWQIIQLLPSSYNQKRTVLLNYEVLNNIYKSRKNHKLDEWSIGFMNWIKSLPYAKELIIGEN